MTDIPSEYPPLGLCETFTDYEDARARLWEVLREDCDARLERVDEHWKIFWRFT